MGELICGLKLTHDGGMAVVDGDRLLFSIEAEKLDNRPRHAPLNSIRDLADLLEANGLSGADLAAVAVDGWASGADGESWVEILDDAGGRTPVDVAGYQDPEDASGRLLSGHRAAAPLFSADLTEFRSFTHGTDHALASYCTSPFAERAQPALILVWDGGMAPCLYRFDPATRLLTAYGALMPISGGIYPIFASHFAPFKVDHGRRRRDRIWAGPSMEALLPVAGKAMAYAALDEPVEPAFAVMDDATEAIGPMEVAVRMYLWSRRVIDRLAPLQLSDAAIIASFQEYLCRRLLATLEAWLAERPDLRDSSICLSGGCALNIKWNARLRASGMFSDVWVPPFPNDAGSAIGAACAEMIRRTGQSALRWSVFSGPPVRPAAPVVGWSARRCEIEEVAALLAHDAEPVVVLHGRAELGPRALGHRSIIAPPAPAAMRDRLNGMKGREWYRPVAPICLEDRAPTVFSPGGRDPYMLFDHQVRTEWRDRIPAVTHVDGSARLQTVGPDNPLMHRLLTAYAERTGVPVLCNTSANFKGSGFFPDVASAMRWGGTRFVWSENTLYWTDREPAAAD